MRSLGRHLFGIAFVKVDVFPLLKMDVILKLKFFSKMVGILNNQEKTKQRSTIEELFLSYTFCTMLIAILSIPRVFALRVFRGLKHRNTLTKYDNSVRRS